MAKTGLAKKMAGVGAAHVQATKPSQVQEQPSVDAEQTETQVSAPPTMTVGEALKQEIQGGSIFHKHGVNRAQQVETLLAMKERQKTDEKFALTNVDVDNIRKIMSVQTKNQDGETAVLDGWIQGVALSFYFERVEGTHGKDKVIVFKARPGSKYTSVLDFYRASAYSWVPEGQKAMACNWARDGYSDTVLDAELAEFFRDYGDQINMRAGTAGWCYDLRPLGPKEGDRLPTIMREKRDAIDRLNGRVPLTEEQIQIQKDAAKAKKAEEKEAAKRGAGGHAGPEGAKGPAAKADTAPDSAKKANEASELAQKKDEEAREKAATLAGAQAELDKRLEEARAREANPDSTPEEVAAANTAVTEAVQAVVATAAEVSQAAAASAEASHVAAEEAAKAAAGTDELPLEAIMLSQKFSGPIDEPHGQVLAYRAFIYLARLLKLSGPSTSKLVHDELPILLAEHAEGRVDETIKTYTQRGLEAVKAITPATT